MRRAVSKVSRFLPPKFKEIIVGSPARPSWVANAVHSLLNRIPGEKFPCLPCEGILAGYQMKVDWLRHRGFIYGTWEPEVVEALSKSVRLNTVAIDIGAHIGYYALVLSRLVGPQGRVIAFEPMPGNFKMLQENIRLNNCSHVEVINAAVLDRTRQLGATVPDQEALPGSVSLFTDYGTESVAVNAISLDDFMSDRQHRVDFVQMDVEGAEGLVLDGARVTIELNRPSMLIEVHHFDGQLERNPVPRQLQSLNYDIRWLSRWPFTSHLLATPKEKPLNDPRAVSGTGTDQLTDLANG